MPRLLQAQGHLAVLIEGDMKDVFLPGSEISRNGCGLVVSRRIGSYLHLESMFPGRYLHGMEFMPLNVMEYAKTFFVRSFQRMCIVHIRWKERTKNVLAYSITFKGMNSMPCKYLPGNMDSRCR